MNRVELAEYGPYVDLKAVSQNTAIPAAELRSLIANASSRIKSTLSLDSAFEWSDGSRFRPVNFAGLLRLAPNVELEVRPKFLPAWAATWREDFFTVATVARYGRVLPRDALLAALGQKGDLADLIARTVVHMYNTNRRRPLRVYRQRLWQDVEIEGDVDPESALNPEEDGFLQSGIVLDHQNYYNDVIFRAMGLLLSEVRNGDLRRELGNARADLAPQVAVRRPRQRRRLPNRHRRWQDLYDLSQKVTEGFGVNYGQHLAPSMPGYLIKTIDAWESLVFIGLRFGLPGHSITKKVHPLGSRWTCGQVEGIGSTPDATVANASGSLFIVDAKYKGRFQLDGQERPSIQTPDLYEALAFLRASKGKLAVLVYPMIPEPLAVSTPGSAFIFERDIVDDCEIVAAAVSVSGIARSGGFRLFASNLATFLGALRT